MTRIPRIGADTMLLRCKLDGLLLEAYRNADGQALVAYDGDEGFEMERVEAQYYEVVASSPHDLDWLDQSGYRILRLAGDFSFIHQRLGA